MLCFDVICLTLDTTSQSKKPKTEEPKASVNRTATDFGNFKCTVRRSRIGMKTYETATAIMRGTSTGLSQWSAKPIRITVRVTRLAVCSFVGDMLLRELDGSFKKLATSKD